MDSKEVGLAAGLIFGKHFLKTEDLHYGYWEGLEGTLENLPKAQKQYSEKLMSFFPAGVQKILDVGSGSGTFAKDLLANGFEVDCVSPSSVLVEYVEKKMGDRAQIYRCPFEEVQTSKRYDLILFSESFQYMKLTQVFHQSIKLLNPKGSILIGDFFQKTREPGPLGGGHLLEDFFRELENHPLDIDLDVDITPQTAPTMDLVGTLLGDVAKPIRNLVSDMMEHRHPMFVKLLRWQFKNKIEKLNRKYFSGELNAANFSKYKSYRVFRLRHSSVT